MRFPTRQELEITYWGDGLAFINIKSNLYKPIKADPVMKDFIICEYGIYKFESDTVVYRHNKQPLMFFMSHEEVLDKRYVDNIKKYYRKKEFLLLKDELLKAYPKTLADKPFSTIWEMMEEIVKKTQHYAIDLNTDKFLPFLKAYSPKAVRMLNVVSNDAKKGVDSMSPPPLQKIMSFGMWMAIAIIAFALISNIPEIMRQIESYF